MKPLLYVDTLRRTRPSQAVTRVRRLVPPAVLALGTTSSTAPDWRPIARGLGVDPAPQSGPTPPPDETRTFTAVGASRPFGSPAFWTDRSDGLLFLFHLHGFSPLAAYAAGERSHAGDDFWSDVVEDWLRNEARPRLPSWHPYPTSLRLIAWCAALPALGWSTRLRERVAAEIARQARYLRRSVEHDIGGNHVLKNATALIFAGAVVPSSGVFDAGVALLRRQLRRQLLSDGGHEERSTSYHRAVAHDLSELQVLIERAGHRPPEWLSTSAGRTASWRAHLAGPDRRLPLLNDSWEGPTEPARTEEPCTTLADSGYNVFRHGGDQAVFDAGPLSPPHLPPHAHADVLSFVFWAEGRPLIVDPGSYAYTGPWRDQFRATSAHNTVEVDGRDQCQLWGDFRIAYPPRVRVLPARRHHSAWVTTACHDGYRRLHDPVEHHRAFIWLAGKGIIVIDRLRCRSAHAVRSRLHVAPGAPLNGADRVGSFTFLPLGVASATRRSEAPYAPFLGRKVPAPIVEVAGTIEPDRPFGWSLLRGGASVESVGLDCVEVTAPGEPAWSIPLDWA